MQESMKKLLIIGVFVNFFGYTEDVGLFFGGFYLWGILTKRINNSIINLQKILI